MDIISYPELQEEILYDKNRDSKNYNRYIVTCVNDFYKLILEHKELIENEDKNEANTILEIKNTYYRGQANESWDIECSLFRKHLIEKEEQLIQEVLNRRPLDFLNCKNNLEKLVLMQHYGIPTRLLDITINPLVALYFACEDKDQENSDGAVYIFEENHNDNINTREIIGSFSFLKDNGTIEDFKKILDKDKVIFEKSIIESILTKKYLLINPKLNNDRIIAQQGLFLCCSNNFLEGKLDDDKTQIKKKKFVIESAKKIIISKEYKKNILKELDFLGIKKSRLFPELENHAEELIEKFATPHSEEGQKFSNKNSLNSSSSIENTEEFQIQKLNKQLILEIKNSINNTSLQKQILSHISEDFFLFDSKKATVKRIIKRSNILDKDIQEKLIGIIEGESI